jgi:hypothetical protein
MAAEARVESGSPSSYPRAPPPKHRDNFGSHFLNIEQVRPVHLLHDEGCKVNSSFWDILSRNFARARDFGPSRLEYFHESREGFGIDYTLYLAEHFPPPAPKSVASN